MEFHSWVPLVRAPVSASTAELERAIAEAEEEAEQESNPAIRYSLKLESVVEADWIAQRRPYYAIWPAIIDCLLKARLDIPTRLLQLPRSPILLRFPVTPAVVWEGHVVRGMLADIDPPLTDTDAARLELFIDFGYREPKTGEQKWAGSRLGLPLDDATFEEAVGDKLLVATSTTLSTIVSTYEQGPILRNFLRLLVSIALMAEDPDFFEPDILSKDRLKIGGRVTSEVIDRAHRRGKVGWNVGRELEMSPHARRPHFAIRWMGRGKPEKKPVLRPVKGTIVKRKKITDVPTGYIDDDVEEEIETHISRKEPS